MSYTRWSILIMYIFFLQACFAQEGKFQPKTPGFYNLSMNSMLKFYFKAGDSTYIIIRGICKGTQLVLSDCTRIPEDFASKTPPAPTFIKVHGNVLYDFSYRSYIDTP